MDTKTTYESALKATRDLLPDLNHCVEYDSAFMFTNTEAPLAFGEPDSPVVVLRETGNIVPQTVFYDECSPVFIQEFDVLSAVNQKNNRSV